VRVGNDLGGKYQLAVVDAAPVLARVYRREYTDGITGDAGVLVVPVINEVLQVPGHEWADIALAKQIFSVSSKNVQSKVVWRLNSETGGGNNFPAAKAVEVVLLYPDARVRRDKVLDNGYEAVLDVLRAELAFENLELEKRFVLKE
jgi:hypothetical protein